MIVTNVLRIVLQYAVARATPIPMDLMKYDLDEYKLPEFKKAGE
jgi:hypothetical protein